MDEPRVLALLELAANRVLRADPYVSERSAHLVGRTLLIHIRGLEVSASLVFQRDRIQLVSAIDETPDARISATPRELLEMLRSRPDRPRLPAGVIVSGDTDLVFEVKRFVDALEVDWEEEIAVALGDPLARLLGRMVRGGIDWTRRTKQILIADIAEYLGQEIEVAAHRDEVRDHVEEIARLRDDVERLEQRVERLYRVAREKLE